MAQILDMPQLSDTMKIGVLQKWRKNEGDAIKPGEVLAEVETDKAVMDFEAYDPGVLLKRLIADGASVPVGTPIAIIGKAGEDVSKLVEEAKARAAGGAKPAAKPEAPKPEAAKPAAPPAPAPKAPAPPAAPVNGKAARPAAPPAPRPAPAPSAPATKVLASPLARKLATDLGVDLRTVQGTGPGGRIVERDVKAVGSEMGTLEGSPSPPATDYAGQSPAPSTRDGGTAPRASAPLPAQLAPERRAEARPAAVPADDVVKPLSMMRRTIAGRLLEAKTTVPHFYLTVDVEMDAAMEFREQVAQVHGAKLSVNDLVLKACALALRRVPEANASFGEEAITQHARVDIGMAVAIEDGLITPVIRDADKKTIGQIASEARELAKRARDRKLRPEEYTGATFSVSNLGMLGIREFAAIINPPEGAILAVGTVRKEPVVRDDKIVVGQRMSITLSCDHRVVDGALGAKLLQAIVSILEKPISLAF
ncbi:MAG TPA: pyruvate dehydrogenase complex dihydrolipoamide acetyltransferase [Polyangia bacterium]|jgi:pyruvate dehydrogenase E2 component (dihydrolipoamide acetyltransferase)|nr:pyruvate dehydrogenase complex dihydrolipoamide acetyltransferase [Polyangia bacterium]